VAAGFLGSWDNGFVDCTKCTILSWNIQGSKNKLECPRVITFLSTFDVICLHEIKTPLTLHLPGFTYHRADSDSPHRGGTAIMIKNFLAQHIVQVNTPCTDCIIVKLRNLPRTAIATCYIPPGDSPYHSFSPIAEIKYEIERDPRSHVIIIGDLNARFGDSRSEREVELPPGAHYSLH
jgi:exonuclease III